MSDSQWLAVSLVMTVHKRAD